MIIWVVLIILFVLAVFGAGAYAGWAWSGTS